LFADIDSFLRSHGFVIHKLWPSRGTLRPLVFNNDPTASSNQLLWADAVYVRDFMALEALPPDSLAKLAVMLHENYSSFDFAASVLGVYDQKTNMRLQAKYLRQLMTG
jgi:hypothetical protein